MKAEGDENRIRQTLKESSLHFLAGDPETLIHIDEQAPMEPFAQRTLDFLAALAAGLRAHSQIRSFPDVAAFAFWCRRANLEREKEEYYPEQEKYRLGRGVSVHFTPSNIPVLFAFSMTAGLLAGNCAIVRLARKSSLQEEMICEVMKELMAGEYADFAPRIVLCRYGHEKELTDYLSGLADVRILWGSDESVQEIRKSPLPPRGIDIPFAARSSAAVISAGEILSTDRLPALALDFYNDTYLNDQNACSSPHILCWIGDEEETARARERFWGEVAALLKQRPYPVPAELAVRKLEAGLVLAAGWDAQELIRQDQENTVVRVQVPALCPELWEHTAAGGFFIECRGEDLSCITPILTGHCQTIAVCGVKPDEIARLCARERVRGADRIVPFGHTLDFELTWDGFNLIENMSRRISC